MKTLHIDVANKIATYQKADGAIVCGNSDYQVEFAFDEEWASHNTKKARFVYGGVYKDVEFTGNTCPIPVIVRATEVEVGVYVEGEEMATTTGAKIPCVLSILCKGANATNGKVYINGDSVFVRYSASADGTDFTEEHSEGQRYIGIATGQSAPTEKTGYTWSEYCADDEKVNENSYRISKLEFKENGYSLWFDQYSQNANETLAIPENAQRFVQVDRIFGKHCIFMYQHQYSAPEKNYPKKISVDNGFSVEIPLIPYITEMFGLTEHDYIFFNNGKAYFHQGTRMDETWYMGGDQTVEDGETVLDELYDYGAIIKLAKPIITDISDKFTWDGIIDTEGATSITIESLYNTVDDYSNLHNGDEGEVSKYDVGSVVIEYEL